MAMLQVQFFSKSMRREVTFSALLPLDTPPVPGQPEKGAKPLKALYLLHGYSGNHTDWIHFSRIRELSDQYNIAVFMPSGENHFYLDDEDKGQLYGEFLGRELIQFTRLMFPLSTDRKDTIIGGLSMGGYGAIRNGLKYPDQFGRIIALSSALIPYTIAGVSPDYQDVIADYNYYKRVFGDLNQLLGSDKDPEAQTKQLKERGTLIPEIYMACGSEDFLLDVNRRFHDYLTQEEILHHYIESAGTHDWNFWNEYIGPAIAWAVTDPESVN
ncbi:alpha/beta hydrolase [Paenibacillus rubinfantis]|uniref:alpha/beta hydrolase n=1 Tax=Paenibacillus rubinfantis TaxID=1720296 RepID=UPI00073F7E76|nr:alpha/beta hydrolase family protein [Paenibacillus rubinfantis]